jgi:putative PEP-CTERM system histidine kinase
MAIYSLYLIYIILMLSSVLDLIVHNREWRFIISAGRALGGLPILSGLYGYYAVNPEPEWIPVILFSEVSISLIWVFMAQRLTALREEAPSHSGFFSGMEFAAAAALIGLTGYSLKGTPQFVLEDGFLLFEIYGAVYFYALFSLFCMLFIAWRMEAFWRSLAPGQRWGYKFLVVGCYLVCGGVVWAASYRVTYLRLVPNHFLLLGILLFSGWGLMVYTIARHRILNKKIFVSRKVVYTSIAPLAFAVYLLAVGFISLIMRYWGWPLSLVLQWFFIIFGLILALLYIHSAKIRRRVHFYISTHFYVNKYEYRDEWLAFSKKLQGLFTEKEIIRALHRILIESLYTDTLTIWVGNEEKGYRRASVEVENDAGQPENIWTADEPLVKYLHNHDHFYLEENEPNEDWGEMARQIGGRLQDLKLVLMSSISVGEQFFGIIGVGKEFTGGRYGNDDYDLLTALGTQAATALLAVRMAEELSQRKQVETWSAMSAFVLHDIKNAANMLSLLRQNAPQHLHNPEFQKDMLEAIDNALNRIQKIQGRLVDFKEESFPRFRRLDLGKFLEEYIQMVTKKIPGIVVQSKGAVNLKVETDPELLARILDNLLLNSWEAGGMGTEVRIRLSTESREAVIEVSDTGPGIPPEMLPEDLFRPFKTGKPQGTGIGLWQVKWMTNSLNGKVTAKNINGGGAMLTIRLPIDRGGWGQMRHIS